MTKVVALGDRSAFEIVIKYQKPCKFPNARASIARALIFKLKINDKLACFKAGVHMKAVFWLVIMVLTQISRSRFKQSRISMLIQHVYVLGRFVNFCVIFRYIWR